MAMIFPGMDPYLEHSQLWPGVHSRLIVYLADHLQPQIEPRYLASIEKRVFVQGGDRDIAPDVWLRRRQPSATHSAPIAVAEPDTPRLVRNPLPEEVHETYLALLDRETGQRVVTVLEVVSPTNKYAGEGRRSYREKQREVLASDTHLVEIDLLRNGPHILAVAEWLAQDEGPYDYLSCVNRASEDRSPCELYLTRLRERLPRLRIPLAGNDADATLDLQAVLAQVYEAGRYRERLNYRRPCRPPLSSEDQTWAEALIRDAIPASEA